MTDENIVKQLLDKMTLEEKIGQMTQLMGADLLINASKNNQERKKNSLEDHKIFQVGSISVVSGAKIVRDIQREYLKNSRLKIPLLFMKDVIHGYQLNYQIAAGLGGAFDDQLVFDLSKMQAKEASANGVTVSYTPMGDLTNDPRWGRIMEIPSEDTYLNVNYIEQIVHGMQGDLLAENGNVGTCIKHIAGYGLAESGKDYALAEISKISLENYYYPIYKSAIKAGSLMAMTAFNTLDAIPCTVNQELLKNELREKWKFDGVLISDHSSIPETIIHGVCCDEKDAVIQSVTAGVDIELATNLYQENLHDLVKIGQVSEEIIDNSVTRILKLKEKLGLFANPYGGIDEKLAQNLVNSQKSKELIKRAGNESIVLLKNENNIVPIKKNKKIILLGPLSNTKELIGFNACDAELEQTVTIKEALQNDNVNYIEGMDYINFNQEVINKCVTNTIETVVIAIGEHSRNSGEGVSRANIKIPDSQIKIIKELKNRNKKIIAFIFSGRPLDLTEIIDDLDAAFFCWFPGTETGNSVKELLYGIVSPSAKLSFSFPRSVSQIPIKYNNLPTGRPKTNDYQEYVSGYYDLPNSPLFPFGFGLSYACFKYSNLQVNQRVFKPDEEIVVTIDVENISNIDAKEIVQLYISDKFAKISRPVIELKGYQKKKIKSGQKEKFTFKLSLDSFTYLNSSGVEIYDEGDFIISVGPNSNDLNTVDVKLIIKENNADF